ncbi:MAG: ABC transporter permease [Deltaproteobacteria bacterium]|nr:ABC transporter permease [Deltaproteobacteria bacterium]
MSVGKWKLALRNLSRNRRRNFATGAAIATGFAALIALGGFVNRTENHLRVYTVYLNRVGHINIYKKDGLDKFSTKPRQYSLDDADIAKIKQVVADISNIEIHGGQLIGAGIVGNGCRTVPFVAKGIDPQVDLQLRNHVEMRKWIPRLRDFARGSGLWNYDDQLGGIVISTGLAKILGKTVVYSELPKDQRPVVVVNCAAPDAKEKIAADTNVQLVAGSWTGMMAAQDAEVVATFVSAIPELANSAVEASLAQLQRLYDTNSVTYYSLWLRDPSQLKKNISLIKERLATAGLNVDIYPWMNEEVSPFYSGTMQFVYVMVTFISFVLAAVVILSIFNSATMTIIERSQEIGMMRSIGFTRSQIRRLFEMEMLLLATFSIISGGLVAAIGIFLVNNLGITYNPPGISGGMILKLVPNVKIVVQSGIATLCLALITTVLAVRKVVRTNIAILLLGSQR